VIGWVEWVTERKFDESGQKLPWAVRKHAYNERLRSAPREARAISAADKIHNMQSTVLVLRRGFDAWAKLSGSRAEQLARFRALLPILRVGWDHAILDHYQFVLDALEKA